MQVGIPRVLSFFYYFPFYKTFLEEIGCRVILSRPTSSRTLENLSLCPTDEPCISVKLAFPHCAELLERGVERLFLPTLVSADRYSFYCPKHIGLPAMIRSGLDLPRDFVIAPEINWRLDPSRSMEALFEAGRRLGASRKVVQDAFYLAWRFQSYFTRTAVQQRLTYPQALEKLAGVPFFHRRRPYNPRAVFNAALRVGVVGHSYILYDLIGHNLVERLKEHATVLVPEMVPRREIRRSLEEAVYGKELWSFEQIILGSALYWLKTRAVDCLILIGPFECGPEAVIEVFLEEEAEKHGVPLLILTVDEQTGEAGLVTRLEAFLDTAAEAAQWRRDPGHHQRQHTGSAKPARFLPPPLPEKRVLGFPTMGHLSIALATIFGGDLVNTIGPLPITRRTAELGAELTPEFICYPMTVTIGQMRQCLEAGANTLIMVGGKGRCRLGWYAELQEALLKRAGYEFEMVTINSPLPLQQNYQPFVEAIKQILGHLPPQKLLYSALLGYAKAAAAEKAEAALYALRAREKRRGEADRCFKRLERSLKEAASLSSIKEALRQFQAETSAIVLAEGPPPLKVRLIGEIYAVFEHFVNHEIARTLGSLEDIRIEVQTEITVLNWFRQNILHTPASLWRHRQIARAAHPYLENLVGGHGLDSVGLTALAPGEGIDGVIHLWPFTCMPEIIAQSILTRVVREKEIPLLTVIVNEQTGEAGLQTRIESFAHILQERKAAREEKQTCLAF